MKSNSQSGFAPLLIVGMVAALLVVGTGAYYLGMRQGSTSNNNAAVTPTGQPPAACTRDLKACPDGSSVGRVGPNCEFAPCPMGPTGPMVACTSDAKMCPDGSAVGRVGPNCEFAPCPGDSGSSAPGAPPGGTSYTCPENEYVDCMPGPDRTSSSRCDPTFLKWAQTNCPGFKGAAY